MFIQSNKWGMLDLKALSFKSQIGWDSEQPDLGEDVTAYGRLELDDL